MVTKIFIVILIILVLILLLVWEIYKKGLRQTAIDLILQAEKSIRKGNNLEKLKMVVGGLIAKLPFPFNLVPTSIVEDFVQKIFNEIKDVLDYRGEH